MCTDVVGQATMRECEQAWEQQGNTTHERRETQDKESIAADKANPELSPNPVAGV